MKLYLFDDAVADAWHPFSLSRPCGELLFGALLLRERAERWAGATASGHLTRPWLADYRESGAPPVVSPEELPEEEDRLLLCARAVPEAGSGSPAGPRGQAAFSAGPDAGATTLRLEGRVAGAFLPAGSSNPDRGWLAAPEPLPGSAEAAVGGRLLENVWELVSAFPDRLLADLRSDPGGPGGTRLLDELPPGVHRLGDEAIRAGPGVRIEPGVVLDAREGPIRLGAGVEVRSGTRLTGPLAAGPRSRLLGGAIGVLAAGPFSYLRGEIEASVVLGYSNKAHDGFLGHACLGRWVNLGAMTTNSDLKNNYGPVRLGGPDGDVETGLLKLGCLLGDHVKTGIGTLLTTGGAVGTGSNLYGAAIPPRWVPPFSWGSGADLVEYRKEAFLETARAVMERRDVEWDGATEAWLGSVWEAGRGGAAAGSPG